MWQGDQNGDVPRALRPSVPQALSIYRTSQFRRFLVVGGAAAFLHWLSRFAFSSVVSYTWAVVLAYVVGIVVAFALNKKYVFPHSGRALRDQLFYFALVNLVSFPLVVFVAHFLGEVFLGRWLPREIGLALGHGVAITLPVFVNFALHKFVTFREY